MGRTETRGIPRARSRLGSHPYSSSDPFSFRTYVVALPQGGVGPGSPRTYCPSLDSPKYRCKEPDTPRFESRRPLGVSSPWMISCVMSLRLGFPLFRPSSYPLLPFTSPPPPPSLYPPPPLSLCHPPPPSPGPSSSTPFFCRPPPPPPPSLFPSSFLLSTLGSSSMLSYKMNIFRFLTKQNRSSSILKR